MKYTDEEMAEAALLLAHTDTAKALPPELESTIQDRGRAVAQDMRFSTTKAGAIAVEAPPAAESNVVSIGSRASRTGAYLGWLAAAACFAFAIYEWRSHAIETGKSVATQPATVSTNALLDGKGQTIASMDVDRDGGGKMRVVHLPPGHRYQLWTTTSDATHATAMGSFACDAPAGCDGRELAFSATPAGRPTWAWLTTVNGTEAARPTDSAAIVGSGGIAGGAAP